MPGLSLPNLQLTSQRLPLSTVLAVVSSLIYLSNHMLIVLFLDFSVLDLNF